ncbi:MAG: acyltransferase, partial [Algisphaera sp.]
DVFFVGSGLLIAASFFSRNNLIAFTWARVLRIYPACVAAILFCVFVVGLSFTKLSTGDYLASKQTWSYLIKNSLLLFGIEWKLPGVFEGVPYPGAVNGSLWTLPYELRMYLCVALAGTLLLWLAQRTGRAVLKPMFAAIAIVAMGANIANHFWPFGAFVSGHGLHLFSMFFVGSTAYLYRDQVKLLTPVFLLFSATLAVSLFHPDLFFVVYCVTVPYLVLYLAYVPGGLIRGFNRFGDYSYGIYIYAFPVQQAVVSWKAGVSITAMTLWSFPITFALAYLSWHLLEKRVLKLKKGYEVIERFLARCWPGRASTAVAESTRE